MNNKLRLTLIAAVIGALLAVIVAVCFNIDPFMEKSVGAKVACIILSVWLFFAPTSYVYVFYKLKEKSEGESFETAFRKGVFLGLLFGFELFLLPILIAPVAAILYYIGLFKNNRPSR